MNYNRKRKHLSKSEQRSIDRKELLRQLLPLAKSFGVWMILVTIVAVDYETNRWFSMFFVHAATDLSVVLSKILFIPVKYLTSTSNAIAAPDLNYDMISIANYPLKIELECSAYHAYFALIALVLFSAWELKNKFLYGAVILAVLAVLNSLRIVILGVIGKMFPSILDAMHDYIWNILLVIILWGLWELSNKRLAKTV